MKKIEIKNLSEKASLKAQVITKVATKKVKGGIVIDDVVGL